MPQSDCDEPLIRNVTPFGELVRRVKDGTIELYFDDMREPAKTAVDTDFIRGQIGLGSFGDTVQWDEVKLYGQKVKPPVE